MKPHVRYYHRITEDGSIRTFADIVTMPIEDGTLEGELIETIEWEDA